MADHASLPAADADAPPCAAACPTRPLTRSTVVLQVLVGQRAALPHPAACRRNAQPPQNDLFEALETGTRATHASPPASRNHLHHAVAVRAGNLPTAAAGRDSPDRARSTAKDTTEAATRQGMRCLHSRAPGMICPARAMRLRLQVNANRPLSLPSAAWCLRLAGTPHRRYTSDPQRSEFPQASVRHPPAMPFYMTEEQLACMAFDHKYASSGATLLDSTMQVMSGCGDRSGSRPR